MAIELPSCAHSNIYNIISLFGLGGIVIRRRAHDPMVVGSKPALATFGDLFDHSKDMM